jgi:hypothetical protein
VKGGSGDIIIVCPGCGESFSKSVRIASTQLSRVMLTVYFDPCGISHECKGQAA